MSSNHESPVNPERLVTVKNILDQMLSAGNDATSHDESLRKRQVEYTDAKNGMQVASEDFLEVAERSSANPGDYDDAMLATHAQLNEAGKQLQANEWYREHHPYPPDQG